MNIQYIARLFYIYNGMLGILIGIFVCLHGAEVPSRSYSTQTEQPKSLIETLTTLIAPDVQQKVTKAFLERPELQQKLVDFTLSGVGAGASAAKNILGRVSALANAEYRFLMRELTDLRETAGEISKKIDAGRAVSFIKRLEKTSNTIMRAPGISSEQRKTLLEDMGALLQSLRLILEERLSGERVEFGRLSTAKTKLLDYFKNIQAGFDTIFGVPGNRVAQPSYYSISETIGVLRQLEDYYSIGKTPERLRTFFDGRVARVEDASLVLLSFLVGQPEYARWRQERDHILGLIRRSRPLVERSLVSGAIEKHVLSRIKEMISGDTLASASRQLRDATGFSELFMNMLSLYKKLLAANPTSKLFGHMIKKYEDYIKLLPVSEPGFLEASFDYSRVTAALDTDSRTDGQLVNFFRVMLAPHSASVLSSAAQTMFNLAGGVARFITRASTGATYYNAEFGIMLGPKHYTTQQRFDDLKLTGGAIAYEAGKVLPVNAQQIEWAEVHVPDTALFALTPSWS